MRSNHQRFNALVPLETKIATWLKRPLRAKVLLRAHAGCRTNLYYYTGDMGLPFQDGRPAEYDILDGPRSLPKPQKIREEMIPPQN